jgi:hypothetical protein
VLTRGSAVLAPPFEEDAVLTLAAGP